MIQFDLPKEQSSIIKVIGMGGGGNNAVNYMYDQGIEGVDFIICNTDSQALADSPIPNKVHLGPQLTQGLGAGANPEIGRQATEESVEELKKILEVNTKMAFITAGMGGGTGTGGAPIIAKLCKDLGILTVGIVTSPFSYEGRRRMKQAEEGIKNLKEYVDTLLVISNDKLRLQFGNLPFKAAFAKADNVLATAAKCITDVINIHGTVNVDFADVCTAMRNGGVAILGSATAEGDNRAQKAIDSALSSPLLNDNEIRGANWILLNITSTEGDCEHTIDEMDTIQAYVQEQAGEDCDVILGMAHDNTLGDKLGVTIIATGFHQKPVEQMTRAKRTGGKEPQPKITMVLGEKEEEKKLYEQDKLSLEEKKIEDPMAPHLTDNDATPTQPAPEDKRDDEKKIMELNTHQEKQDAQRKEDSSTSPKNTYPSIESGGYLSRPKHIYTEDQKDGKNTVEQTPENDQKGNPKIELIYKEEKAAENKERQRPINNPQPKEKRPEDNPHIARTVYPYPEWPKKQGQTESQKNEEEDASEPQNTSSSEDKRQAAHGSEQESEEHSEQQESASDRATRLRKLSFDINKLSDPYEVEAVPAYIRRNVALQENQHPSSSETPYSGYHVKKSDDDKQSEISTINTFLDGKKPD